MALEVSCGQCQGRLLVETLGVVVACPHCGTHLSIPAPEPEAGSPTVPEAVAPPPPVPEPPAAPAPALNWAPAPAAAPEPVTASQPPVPTFDWAAPPATESEPAPAAFAWTPAPPDPEPMPAFSVAVPTPVVPDSPMGGFPPAEDPSVLGGTDEQLAEPIQGWHSAPRLHLNPPDVIPETPPAPPMPAPAAAPDATEFQFSSTQQFSLQPAAAAPAPLTFAAATPPASSPAVAPASVPPTFVPAAVPATPATSAPMTFAAASAPVPAGAPAAFTFGAAPASPPSPPTQAASPAPAAVPFAFAAAPQPSQPSVAPTSVAADVVKLEANELEARQRFLLMLLIIVGSYASAVTIVLVYMLVFGRTSALESLPDLVPAKNKNGDISWKYNPPKNDVAPGHVLTLGQSRRFGNVRVTPLKVTRGPIRFEHYSGQAGLARDPSDPVLKLWVKFENVSRDQSFAPLDAHLLYTRRVINLGESIQANGFVCTEANRRSGGPLHYLFDTPILSEFRMSGQRLNTTLEPGESVETFVPSEEDARSLSGDLVWRFQFRKGYHPKSLRGVTTLIDVRFNSKDIQDEA